MNWLRSDTCKTELMVHKTLVNVSECKTNVKSMFGISCQDYLCYIV